MKSEHRTLGLAVVFWINFLAVAPCSCATPPPICEHVVLHKDGDALSVAQAYYPGAADAQITLEEERKAVLQLASMIEDYGKSHGDTKHDAFETREMRKMVQQAKYHIQMVPFQMKEKRVVMLHLLGVQFGQGVWREHYCSPNEGWIHSCRVFVDLTTFKIFRIHCNAAG